MSRLFYPSLPCFKSLLFIRGVVVPLYFVHVFMSALLFVVVVLPSLVLELVSSTLYMLYYVQDLLDFHIYMELTYLSLFPFRYVYHVDIFYVSITHMRGLCIYHLVSSLISRGSFHSTLCPVLALPPWIHPILFLFGDHGCILYPARVCISCGSYMNR